MRSGDRRRIEDAARACPALSVEDAFPVVLALVVDERRYARAAERWTARYRNELDPSPDDAEVQLVAACVAALPSFDTTALAAGEALLVVLEARGLTFACEALRAWLDGLE